MMTVKQRMCRLLLPFPRSVTGSAQDEEAIKALMWPYAYPLPSDSRYRMEEPRFMNFSTPLGFSRAFFDPDLFPFEQACRMNSDLLEDAKDHYLNWFLGEP